MKAFRTAISAYAHPFVTVYEKWSRRFSICHTTCIVSIISVASHTVPVGSAPISSETFSSRASTSASETNGIMPSTTSLATDLMLECDDNVSEEIQTWLTEQQNAILANATVNCDQDIEITNNFEPGSEFISCHEVEGLPVTFTVSDTCANAGPWIAYIYIYDTVPPVMIGPPDTTIECGELLPAPWLFAMDACDTNLFIREPIDSEPTGNNPVIIVRTYYAQDACDNLSSCTQRIYIMDTEGPTIVNPGAIMLNCDEGIPQIEIEATDCSGIGTLNYSDSSPSGADCEMLVLRTIYVSDIYGNTSTCTHHILILDNTPPALTCEDIQVTCTEKSCLTFDDIVVNAFDAPVMISSIEIGGVLVDVKAYQKGGIQVSAALFNTEAPHPDDLDLGSPNSLFGGPGENSDAPDFYNLSNNKSVGNAIIVQTPGYSVANDYFISDSLVFTFSEPVFVESLVVVDFESEQINTGAGVYTFDVNGVSQGFIPLSLALGDDNSLEELSVRRAGVKKLKVYYGTTIPGSGGVARLCFIHTPDPETYDECSEVLITSEYEAITVIDECLTEIAQTYGATDACGNETLENNTRVITIHSDSQQPDIIAPADILIGCSDVVPAPDVTAIVITDNCSDLVSINVEWVQDITTGTGCGQEIRRIYRAVDACGNEALSVQFITREPQVKLTAKVFLAGPYSGPSTMNTLLNGLLNSSHNSQPYSGPPYNYTGTEYVPVFPPNIVDWVYLELRSPANSATIVESRTALLTSSGDIVDLDGISPVTFSAEPGFYFVAVHHRNHLGVLSSAAIDMSSGMGAIDLTAQSSGQIVVSVGVWALVKGDVNVEGLVNNSDMAVLAPIAASGMSGVYSLLDVNMDGIVNNTDVSQLAPLAGSGYAQNF